MDHERNFSRGGQTDGRTDEQKMHFRLSFEKGGGGRGRGKGVIVVALSECISASREICGARAICWVNFLSVVTSLLPFFLRRMAGRWLITEKAGHPHFSFFFFRRTFYNGFNPFIPLARADCESEPVLDASACRARFVDVCISRVCPSLASSRGSSNGVSLRKSIYTAAFE